MFYYFGYGSNMNKISLKAKGVQPIESEPAILKGWKLTFSVPNFFRIEGGTGNIEQAEDQEVHGVLHKCHHLDLEKLDELEALEISYRRREVTVKTYRGSEVKAFVYIGISKNINRATRPSKRYLNILVRGAQASGLRREYLAKLRGFDVSLSPFYRLFRLPDKPAEIYTRERLAATPFHTAMAGAVFNMEDARPEHDFLKCFLERKDVTVFFLKRMDESDGMETFEEVVSGKLSNAQKTYLNGYLHEFNREYQYVGRMDYHVDLTPTIRNAYRTPPGQAAARISLSRLVLESAQEINKELGHENLGFLSETHGLMPLAEPSKSLPVAFGPWDEAAAGLSQSYKNLSLRRSLEELPCLNASSEHLADRHLLRAGAVLAMLAHAYHYVESHPPSKGLPESIGKPWRQVRERLGRPDEVLSYIDLIVYNWQFVDPKRQDPWQIDNLRLLIPTVNNREEQIFYLTQVEILAQSKPIVGAIVRAQEAVVADDAEALGHELMNILLCLQRMVRESLLNIDPNPNSRSYMDPIVWAKTVAPFAVPFHKGVQGPSGTSSPIFNLLDIFLGRRNHRTFLGAEIHSLRRGYPVHWRNFLRAVGEVSVADYVQRTPIAGLKGLLKDVVEVYAGKNGFLARHKLKVFGYLELAFKVGRSITIGGFSGPFRDRTWVQVDSELELARRERLETFPQSCHFAHLKSVGQTHEHSPEGTKHVILDVAHAGIRYEPGDRCGILPENSDDLVARTLSALQASGDETITLTSEWLAAVRLRYGYRNARTVTLRDFLRFGKIRPIDMRVAESLHACTQAKDLLAAMKNHTLDAWEFWDLLQMLAVQGYDPRRLLTSDKQSYEYIANVIPPEHFRLYSIASSMRPEDGTVASEIHLTVGQVTYEAPATSFRAATVRRGSSSHFLASSAGREEPISFIVEHPPRFNLPSDRTLPVVMIAGGTGISPFRSFISELLNRVDGPPLWLFFSITSRAYLYYQEELASGMASGRLKLFVILSQEDFTVEVDSCDENSGRIVYVPSPRGYIQDLLVRPDIAPLVWDLICSRADGGQGAYLYICGRTRLARSIDLALHEIISRHATGVSPASSVDFMKKMAAEGRYIQEIFTNLLPSHQAISDGYDVSDIVEHNSPERGFWLLIDGIVYDLSEYIELHPGGRTIIRSYAGTDASSAFARVHHDRSEVAAIRDIYRMGVLRPLQFADVKKSIASKGGTQIFALSALHRNWQSLLFLVVEMENTLLADQSLQSKTTVAGEDPNERTYYKLQRSLEAHERFLRNYVAELSGDAWLSFWEQTHGMCSSTKERPWMASALQAIQRSSECRAVKALHYALQQELQRIIQSKQDEQTAGDQLRRTCALLEEANAVLIREAKSILTAGMKLFEEHESQVLDLGGEELVSLLVRFPSVVETYFSASVGIAKRFAWDLSGYKDEEGESQEPEDLRSLLATQYWSMLENRQSRYVILRRSALEIFSIESLLAENAEVTANMLAEHIEYGIVVDMRQVAGRNDPEFENAMADIRKEIYKHYRRVSVLLNTTMGVMQVNRIGSSDGKETFATLSESAAISFAKGAGSPLPDADLTAA